MRPLDPAKQYRRLNSEIEMASIRSAFSVHFEKSGYKEEPALKVTDIKKVDATTRLLGSHTSVMKPYIYTETVPAEGLHIIQTTVKTQNLKKYPISEEPITRTSVFECHGLFSHYGDLRKTIGDVENYLEHVLQIGSKMIYQINSADTDLLDAVHEVIKYGRIDVDTLPLEKTRHAFGDPRLLGRDIRIEMEGATTRPCAVIIAMDVDGKAKYVETTIAPCVLMQQTYNLSHVLDTFPIEPLQSNNPVLEQKFEDSIITTALLLHEGLKPGGSENKRRILRSYFNFMSSSAKTLNLDNVKFENIYAGYESRKYGNTDTTNYVMQNLAF